jgi:carbon storage regulator CsrA
VAKAVRSKSGFFVRESSMLVLSRKVGERIVIGENITLVVKRVAGHRVTLGIEAPNSVHVVRGELKPFSQEERVSRAMVVEVDTDPALMLVGKPR